jgi:four helix bundle protein
MLKVEDLEIYQLSMSTAEEIWEAISGWNKFDKDTIGKQLIRAVDSIGANIAEGFGRYHYQENKHFCYYARGSLFETKTWLQKALNRDLIKENQKNKIIEELDMLHHKLNAYIKSIGNHSASNQ